MSGGVDSSVAAYLLNKATPNNFSKLFGRPTPKGFRGYDVTGVFMKCWNGGPSTELGAECTWERDSEDVRRVAGKLGIPFYIWDFEEEYKKKVIEYMVDGYRKGETPNPDVMCNREIKFGLFLKHALELGADYVATGHYVRLACRHISTGTGRLFAPAAKSGLDSRFDDSADGGRAHRSSETFRTKHAGKLSFALLEAKDKNKDQSYFLWTLTQNELRYCLFPIGDYLKSEVRTIARKADLPTATKKDSQGICFLGQVSLTDFLKGYLPEKRGLVVSITGEKLGEHMGAQFYTIGQRHGLDLKEKNTALRISGEHITQPHYVTEKNIKTNTLTVAEGDKNPALFKKKITLRDVSFVDMSHSNVLKNIRMSKMRVLARVRYRQPVSSATLIRDKRGAYKLFFDSPQKFVAPGQSAVFYNLHGKMLGGGVIQC